MSNTLLRVRAFRGLDQSRGDWGGDPAAAAQCVNFICRGGVLERASGMTAISPQPPAGCVRLFQAFFRTDGADDSRLVAAGNGCLYALTGGAWTTLGTGFASDDWCAVNYRKGESDLLILTNGRGPMQTWDGKSASLTPITPTVDGQNTAFERLTLIYERLWGAVCASQPDRVYWSESFAPDSWALNPDIPDSGGGYADVATFDGSRIRAVTAAFDDVLIVKDRSLHRLSGTYPGDFTLTQVYGGEGTLAPRTLVQTADRLYFLGRDGLCVYDGMTVSSLVHRGDERARGVFERLNPDAVDQACAVLTGDVMYIALPLDGASANSHVLRYSLADDSWALLSLAGVRDFLIHRDGQKEELLCLTDEGLFQLGGGDTFGTESIAAEWLSPQLLGDRRIERKRTNRLRVTVETEKAGAITLFTQSERGRAERTIDLPAGISVLKPRLRVCGRRIRFGLKTSAPVRLPEGLALEIEVDEP